MTLDPLPPRRGQIFEPRTLDNLLTTLNRHVSEQAASAGGLDKQVPSPWVLEVNFNYRVELRDTSGLTHISRPRWSEVSTTVTAVRRCSVELAFRPARFYMYRYLVPRFPTARGSIIGGFLTFS